MRQVFVVLGEEMVVQVPINATLGEARDLALLQGGAHGIPGEQWEIRNEKGYLLGSNQPATSVEGGRIFLGLKIGVGA